MITYSPNERIEWRRDGLIWRKVTVEVDRNASPIGPAAEPPPEPKATPHDIVSCPTCEARMDEPCRDAAGRTMAAKNSHADRLAPRVCPCGASLNNYARACDPCRERKASAAQLNARRVLTKKRRAERKDAA